MPDEPGDHNPSGPQSGSNHAADPLEVRTAARQLAAGGDAAAAARLLRELCRTATATDAELGILRELLFLDPDDAAAEARLAVLTGAVEPASAGSGWAQLLADKDRQLAHTRGELDALEDTVRELEARALERSQETARLTKQLAEAGLEREAELQSERRTLADQLARNRAVLEARLREAERRLLESEEVRDGEQRRAHAERLEQDRIRVAVEGKLLEAKAVHTDLVAEVSTERTARSRAEENLLRADALRAEAIRASEEHAQRAGSLALELESTHAALQLAREQISRMHSAMGALREQHDLAQQREAAGRTRDGARLDALERSLAQAGQALAVAQIQARDARQQELDSAARATAHSARLEHELAAARSEAEDAANAATALSERIALLGEEHAAQLAQLQEHSARLLERETGDAALRLRAVQDSARASLELLSQERDRAHSERVALRAELDALREREAAARTEHETERRTARVEISLREREIARARAAAAAVERVNQDLLAAAEDARRESREALARSLATEQRMARELRDVEATADRERQRSAAELLALSAAAVADNPEQQQVRARVAADVSLAPELERAQLQGQRLAAELAAVRERMAGRDRELTETLARLAHEAATHAVERERLRGRLAEARARTLAATMTATAVTAAAGTAREPAPASPVSVPLRDPIRTTDRNLELAARLATAERNEARADAARAVQVADGLRTALVLAEARQRTAEQAAEAGRAAVAELETLRSQEQERLAQARREWQNELHAAAAALATSEVARRTEAAATSVAANASAQAVAQAAAAAAEAQAALRHEAGLRVHDATQAAARISELERLLAIRDEESSTLLQAAHDSAARAQRWELEAEQARADAVRARTRLELGESEQSAAQLAATQRLARAEAAAEEQARHTFELALALETHRIESVKESRAAATRARNLAGAHDRFAKLVLGLVALLAVTWLLSGPGAGGRAAGGRAAAPPPPYRAVQPERIIPAQAPATTRNEAPTGATARVAHQTAWAAATRESGNATIHVQATRLTPTLMAGLKPGLAERLLAGVARHSATGDQVLLFVADRSGKGLPAASEVLAGLSAIDTNGEVLAVRAVPGTERAVSTRTGDRERRLTSLSIAISVRQLRDAPLGGLRIRLPTGGDLEVALAAAPDPPQTSGETDNSSGLLP